MKAMTVAQHPTLFEVGESSWEKHEPAYYFGMY